MTAPRDRITECLLSLAPGDRAAAEDLMPPVYDEMRRLAASFLQRERPDHTLQPTALVHEAYLRLVDQTRVNWESRAHFMAIAAETIRRILVDHARARKTAKRGGEWERVSISDTPLSDAHNAHDEHDGNRDVNLLDLDEALAELRQLHERQSRVVELRFFGGLDGQAIAHVLGVSRTTVQEDWLVARAWLSRRLGGETPS